MDISALRCTLEEAGQAHLLKHWDTLNDTEKESLYKDLSSINYKDLNGYFAKCQDALARAGEKVDAGMEPLPEEYVGSYVRTDAAKLADYEMEGRSLRKNKLY